MNQEIAKKKIFQSEKMKLKSLVKYEALKKEDYSLYEKNGVILVKILSY